MEAIAYMSRAFPNNAIDTRFSLIDPKSKVVIATSVSCHVRGVIWKANIYKTPYPCGSQLKDNLQLEGQAGK